MTAVIALAISSLNPYLATEATHRYADAINVAAERFNIPPAYLIVICQQESSFREHLPVGPAGERGPFQIREAWLTNPVFRSQFPGAQIQDLERFETSVEMAAFILAEVRGRLGSRNYLGYYNSPNPEVHQPYVERLNKWLDVVEPRFSILERYGSNL